MYAVGIFVYLDAETMENVEVHEGGFLGLGYTTCDHRKTTTKDSWLSLLWPILITLWFCKATIWLLHDCLGFVFLLFGFDYRNTKAYKYINKKLM